MRQLFLLATLIPCLSAQFHPNFSPALREHLKLTTAQVTSIIDINWRFAADEARLRAQRFQFLRANQITLQGLKAADPDHIESQFRELDTRRAQANAAMTDLEVARRTMRRKLQALLTPAQQEKLAQLRPQLLNDAIACDAAQYNLLDLPPTPGARACRIFGRI
jgi:hypothetical protein